MIEITPIYAALIAMMMAVFATRTAMLRGKYQVGLGDNGHAELRLWRRRFGNLSEYAAMVLLLMLMMEMKGVSSFWLHAYGIVFVALRLLHPIILFDDTRVPLARKLGRGLAGGGTALLLVIGAVSLLLMR